eukprot:2438834-Amphidinium_carterae.1
MVSDCKEKTQIAAYTIQVTIVLDEFQKGTSNASSSLRRQSFAPNGPQYFQGNQAETVANLGAAEHDPHEPSAAWLHWE